MQKKHFIYGFVLAIVFTISGCGNISQTDVESFIAKTDDYEKISQEDAKKALDSNSPPILLDVRFESEYEEAHIPGAILIPVSALMERAESELPDKDALILIYCESGYRSKTAAEMLIDMGYTYVKDIGGLDMWDYETE